MFKMPKFKKRKTVLLFGGDSEEHEISILSAKNILKAVDKNKNSITLVGITKDGSWKRIRSAQLLDDSYGEVMDDDSETEVSFSFSKKQFCFKKKGRNQMIKFDIAFPVLHGKNGEDGTIQGFFEVAGIPYVGGDVLGSAVGMDKEVAKRILLQAKLPVAKYLATENFSKIPTYKEASKKLGKCLFVKPARSGSSIGVSKVENEKDYVKAVKTAYKEDSKILIEENIEGREIECAVIGNSKPKVSAVGEVVVHEKFYSYEEKYNSSSTANIVIPANLTKEESGAAKQLALDTYKALCCRGLARIDMFISKGRLYVNEINTMPGFTDKSMYPKLWEEEGVSYKKLINNLLDLAVKKN